MNRDITVFILITLIRYLDIILEIAISRGDIIIVISLSDFIGFFFFWKSRLSSCHMVDSVFANLLSLSS